MGDTAATTRAAGSGSTMRPPETFRELLHARFARHDMSFRPGDKLQVRALIKKLGFGEASPELLAVFEKPGDIILHDLPETFVIKPTCMNGCCGLHVMHRIAGGQGWFDSVSRKRVWQGQVRETFEKWKAAWEARRSAPFKIIVEEKISSARDPSEIPLDYKFYTFNGTVRFIYQVDRNTSPLTVAYHGRDFSPWAWEEAVIPALPRVRVGEAVIPKHADSMLEMAAAISRKLNTPFCSIDMFDSSRGPIIGELTPSPGAPYQQNLFSFKDTFDRSLYQQWLTEAEALGQPIHPIPVDDEIPMKKIPIRIKPAP